jgi:8-oxo-dGTP pyrophosphatase MutT (NUDIX family)
MKLQDVYNLILESGVGRFSGAGIIFFDNKNVLMLKKPNNKWVFPGGKPIMGETPLETAMRESTEEVGSCPGNMVDKLMFENDDRIFCSFIFKIDRPFEVVISAEHKDYSWIDYREIKKVRLQNNIYRTANTVIKVLDKLTLI